MDRKDLFYDENEDLVDLRGEDDSSRFFSPLLTRSDTALKVALSRIDSSVRIWASQAPLKDEIAAKLLRCHLPTILRLSIACPVEEVRSSLSKLLTDLEEHGPCVPKPLHSGPSSYLPSSQVLSASSCDDEVSHLFMDAFLYDGRVSRITQVMGDHPAYLKCHIRCQHYLMHGNGPLPFEWRPMIGILASARHQCGTVVRILMKDFKDLQGDPSWLKGIDYLPRKLQNLLEINKLLAHQPWLLKQKHFEDLLQPGPDSWSMGELVHALVLLAHWHAMSSFVYGVGVKPELDMPEGHTYTVGACSGGAGTEASEGSERRSEQAPTTARSTTPVVITNGGNGVGPHGNGSSGGKSNVPGSSSKGVIRVGSREDVGELAEKMKGLKAEEDDDDDSGAEDQLENFQQIYGGSSENGDGSSSCCGPCPECVLPFLDEPSFTHKNFAERGEGSGIHPFRLYDYCWEDHGFSLVNRLYSDIGPLLDEKFSCVTSLTYNKIGDLENIDTSSFRRGVFNYIHCIKGIFHDDYNYGQVNQLLSRELKTYVKMVTCFPEKVTAAEFECLEMFKPSEQVHINFLLLEARLQAELLYALRALNAYITSRC